MAELCICLYGDGPSFRAGDGPITARVEVPGGTEAFLVDPERQRCRLEAVPGPDLDKWTSPRGVLQLARLGWWGLRAIEDRLPRPGPFAVRDPPARRCRRPFLPRDIAGCVVCGKVVVLERGRKKGSPALPVTPCRRMAARIRSLLEAAGVPPLGVACVGDRAHRPHSRDCAGLFAPRAPRKRGRGRPRLPPRPFVPLPWKVGKPAGPSR